ncbi:type III secretion protein HrpD [Cupriavidus necator]|uniref:type III secretion protein HrpD n=1 Tax=Cupriavidus necator TaxID=106590 RepID=UPI001490701E|nr:type III secretion protein HrpD [Cupriavidus necator]NOV22517.1 type III secretion protein HrpD [Cupriavidus necator]
MMPGNADPRLGQLETVRQRRHEDAMRALQQRRAQVMAGLRQAEAAQQAVHAALAERAAFIERLRQGAARGGVSVSGLLDAQGWQGAFDARIARANARLAEVLDDVAQRRAAFDEARRALLRAQARLDGARELARREHRALRAEAGRRDDEAIDEAAARAWHAARHA